MNAPKQQLTESLLAACKAAGIEKPRFIVQDKIGFIRHYEKVPVMISHKMWQINGATHLKHPPYASDWRDSLLEWVDHIADTSKMIPIGIDAMVCDDIAKQLGNGRGLND